MNSTALVRLPLKIASRGRFSVLIFHRVLETKDELLPSEPSAAEFERTMSWVKQAFDVIPLAVGIAGLKAGRLPNRALAITFDDGYANNATIAAPILSRLGLHATFFVATGFLDGGRMFNDTVIESLRRFPGSELDLRAVGLGRHNTSTLVGRRQTVHALLSQIKYRAPSERIDLAERIAGNTGVEPPKDLMMASAQVHALARAGFEIGGHTVNHPILAQLDASSARREIVGGRDRLEAITGSRIRLFAYPNGRPNEDYTRATVDLVRQAGFDGAVSTSGGVARHGSDPFQVPRFTPWRLHRLQFTGQMLTNLIRATPAYAG